MVRAGLAGPGRCPYLERMAIPRPSRPAVVWRDLKNFLAGRQRHQLLFAALSVMIPALLIAGFYVDSHVEPPKPEMMFLPSWPATRSDAEIIAQQKIDQKKREAAQAEKRRQFQQLEKRLGI